MSQAAASIKDTEKRVKAVRNAWIETMPIDGFLSQDSKLAEERAVRQEHFITAMLESSDFQNDKEVWQRLLEYIEFSYWNRFETRINLTTEQEKEWADKIWGIVERVLVKMPDLNAVNCNPRAFYLFENQCELQTLVARKKYQEAMQLFDDPNKGLAARAILFERFISEDKNFRDSMNGGSLFPHIYNSGKWCPIKEAR